MSSSMSFTDSMDTGRPVPAIWGEHQQQRGGLLPLSLYSQPGVAALPRVPAAELWAGLLRPPVPPWSRDPAPLIPALPFSRRRNNGSPGAPLPGTIGAGWVSLHHGG